MTETTIAAQNAPTTDAALAAAVRASERRVVPRPRFGVWGLTAVTVLVLLVVAANVGASSTFGWSTVAEYLFAPQILEGLWLTVWLTAVVFVLSLVVGGLLAAMRLSGQRFLAGFSWVYVWLFRSIPLLVLLLIWFNIAYLFPELALTLPGLPPLVSFPTVGLVTAISASIVGLTLHESAFAAEIIRGGLVGVPKGQHEAAFSLALAPGRTFFRVILPQAMPSILPNAGSLLIGTVKATSMVSVIAVTDLLYSAQIIYQRNFLVMPLLFVACFWYLLLTSLLGAAQYALERHYAKSRSAAPRRTAAVQAEVVA